MISLFKNFNLVLSVISTASESKRLVTLDSLTGVAPPRPSATCLEKAPALRRIPFLGLGPALRLKLVVPRPILRLDSTPRGFCSLFYLTRICLRFLTLSFFWRYKIRNSFLNLVYTRAQPSSPLVRAVMTPRKSPSAGFPAPCSLLAQLVIREATPVLIVYFKSPVGNNNVWKKKFADP
jgi:hypothetical protein